MIQYIIAGLALGSLYAIAAAALTVTYVSTGILNFALGATAFFVARFFYYLHVQQQWGLLSSALVALFVLGPLMGAGLWLVLFRLLQRSTPLIKVVATIGLAVTLPPVSTLLFGNELITNVPGLAPAPVRVFHIAGVAVTLDQVIIYLCLAAMVVIGTVILRYTAAGLYVRATVDSTALTGLQGVNATLVAVSVWVATTFLAGLTGVLAAPLLGLDPGHYTLLAASAFAAVVAARFRGLGVAVLVSLAMGVLGALGQRYLQDSQALSTAVVSSIPFAVIVVVLLYWALRGQGVTESVRGATLDRAVQIRAVASGWAKASPSASRTLGGAAVGAALLLVSPYVLDKFWGGLVGLGVAFGVVFLSITLVTGYGGMIWLCQISFAGVGAMLTAQLAGERGWPLLLAYLAAGLVAAVLGAIIGLLTVRLGDLYVAVVTFAFALLVQQLVFSRDVFYNAGQGVAVGRPSFAPSDRQFAVFAIVVFLLLALLVTNMRRSLPGLALAGARSSPAAAESLGLRVVRLRVGLAAGAAFVAAVGGGLLATYAGVALPDSYQPLEGLIWLAVLVTVGVRSNVAAVVAGLSYAMFPALVTSYLPASWANVPAAMFGLGAVMVAKNPDGVLAEQVRYLQQLVAGLRRGSGSGAGGTPGGGRRRARSPEVNGESVPATAEANHG